MQRFSFAQVSQALNIPQFKPAKSVKNTFLNVKVLFKIDARTTTKIFEKCCQSGCLVGLQNAFSSSFFLIIGSDLGCEVAIFTSLTGFKHSLIQTCKICIILITLHVQLFFIFDEQMKTPIFEQSYQFA